MTYTETHTTTAGSGKRLAIEKAGNGRVTLNVYGTRAPGDLVAFFGDSDLGGAEGRRALAKAILDGLPIDKPGPELPTEVGFYEDADLDVWQLKGNGKWKCRTTQGVDDPENYLPFVKLVAEKPAPVLAEPVTPRFRLVSFTRTSSPFADRAFGVHDVQEGRIAKFGAYRSSATEAIEKLLDGSRRTGYYLWTPVDLVDNIRPTR